MASAGRVLLLPKGEWESGTEYKPMDYVLSEGSSYVCKASVSGSTKPASDTSHWQILAKGFDASALVKTSDVLSLEEIKASTSLTGKLPSAQAVNDLNQHLVNNENKTDSIGDFEVLYGGCAFVEHQIITVDDLKKYRFIFVTNDYGGDELNPSFIPMGLFRIVGRWYTVNFSIFSHQYYHHFKYISDTQIELWSDENNYNFVYIFGIK